MIDITHKRYAFWLVTICLLYICILMFGCVGLHAATAPSCDASLMKHVYNPNRLIVLDPCKPIKGVCLAYN